MISKGFRAVERRHRDEDESDDACENKDDDDEFHGKKLPQVVWESRDRLKKIYKEGKVLVGYGLCEESGGGTPVDEIFVNITLVPRENLDQIFTEAPIGARSVWTPPRPSHALQSSAVVEQGGIELSELFVSHRKSPGQSSTTISGVMAIGSGGIGKSTVFTCRLPYLWSLGQCMEDVDLLLCVPLGDVSNVQIGSAEELFASFLDLDSDEKKTMLHYVRENPSRACIVLDGVDECKDIMERASPFMMKLLKGKTTLCGLKSIVTSRPCRAVHQLAQQGCFDRKLEVVGFSSSDVGTFVNKALPAAKASTMMQKLAESDETRSLMTTPFMASLCCEEFGRSGLLSDCTTSLFEKMVVRLLEVQAKERFGRIESLPPEQKSILEELGRFAYDKFVARHFSFSEAELVSLSEKAKHLGCLVACGGGMSAHSPRHFRFSHLLLQEFIAAYFAAMHLVRSRCDVLDVMAHVKTSEGQSIDFVVFLFAQLDAERILFTQSPVAGQVLDAALGPTNAPFCTGNLQEIHSVLAAVMDRQAMNSLAAILLQGVCPPEFAQIAVENQMSRSREMRDSNFLLSLLELWKEKRPLANKSGLCSALQQIKNGEILEVEAVKQLFSLDIDSDQRDLSALIAKQEECTPTALVQAATSACKNPHIRCMLYSCAQWLYALWLSAYERLKKCGLSKFDMMSLRGISHILIIGNANYTAARIAPVLQSMSQPKQEIKEVTVLCEEDVMGGSVTDGILSLLKVLHIHEGLETVQLVNLNWSSERLIALSVLLNVRKDTMSSLELGNLLPSYFNDSLHFLLPGLAACSKITTLKFVNIKLDEESVGMLYNALQSGKMPLLQVFTANGCNIDSPACIRLLRALSTGSCAGLQELFLKDNGLSTSCIASFCALLQMCPELQTVDIRGSCLFSDGDGSSLDRLLLPLAQHIMRCNALKSFLLFDDEAHFMEVRLMLPIAAIAFCSLVDNPSSCIECLW